MDSKIHMKLQGTLNSQNKLEKEKQHQMAGTFGLQTYYKATVIKQCGAGIRKDI